MKIQEDPWENYLYFDSKYVLPIVCHATDLPIEKQCLLAMFIHRAVADETISQYKVQGEKLAALLIDFVEHEFSFDALEDVDDLDDDDDDIDSILKPKSKGSNLL